MVKITNGKDIFEVTRGAFDGIYSRQGYTILDEKKDDQKVANANANDDKRTEEDKFIDEIIEKPISQWNKDEIKRFAAIKEIDISGVKSAGEAKELIKKFLEENEGE